MCVKIEPKEKYDLTMELVHPGDRSTGVYPLSITIPEFHAGMPREDRERVREHVYESMKDLIDHPQFRVIFSDECEICGNLASGCQCPPFEDD
jgi:hypothetical protein